MRNGKRRHVIEIQRQVQVGTLGIGEKNFVWQTWREIFAELEVRRGKEFLSGNQRVSEVVWRFHVRYEEVVGLDASMRVVHEGMTFDIKSPLPDGQFHRDCVIECTLQQGVIGSAPLLLQLTKNTPAGEVGQPYLGMLPTASGGTPPYVFSATEGNLPAGLTINSEDGSVGGVPTASGEYPFVIRVTDAVGDVSDLPEIKITVT